MKDLLGSDHYQVMTRQAVLRFSTLTACLLCFLEEQRMQFEDQTLTVLSTDEVNTQWRQVLALMKTDVIYALSPQAKGKIEHPYRWLPDWIVRSYALEHLTSLTDARPVLHEEGHHYNYQQVHSTTGEIPARRFEKAQNEHFSRFRPFAIQKPFFS